MDHKEVLGKEPIKMIFSPLCSPVFSGFSFVNSPERNLDDKPELSPLPNKSKVPLVSPPPLWLALLVKLLVTFNLSCAPQGQLEIFLKQRLWKTN